MLPWLQCIAMVTVCCHGYSVLPWLQCVAMVTGAPGAAVSEDHPGASA